MITFRPPKEKPCKWKVIMCTSEFCCSISRCSCDFHACKLFMLFVVAFDTLQIGFRVQELQLAGKNWAAIACSTARCTHTCLVHTYICVVLTHIAGHNRKSEQKNTWHFFRFSCLFFLVLDFVAVLFCGHKIHNDAHSTREQQPGCINTSTYKYTGKY